MRISRRTLSEEAGRPVRRAGRPPCTRRAHEGSPQRTGRHGSYSAYGRRSVPRGNHVTEPPYATGGDRERLPKHRPRLRAGCPEARASAASVFARCRTSIPGTGLLCERATSTQRPAWEPSTLRPSLQRSMIWRTPRRTRSASPSNATNRASITRGNSKASREHSRILSGLELFSAPPSQSGIVWTHRYSGSAYSWINRLALRAVIVTAPC